LGSFSLLFHQQKRKGMKKIKEEIEIQTKKRVIDLREKKRVFNK